MNIVVNEEQKKRWEEHADEDPSTDSVSDLVRTAVERYIADGNSGMNQLNTEVLEDIAESLDSIDSKIGTVDEDLNMLRNENIKETLMSEILRSEMGGIEDDLDRLEIITKKTLKEARQNNREEGGLDE